MGTGLTIVDRTIRLLAAGHRISTAPTCPWVLARGLCRGVLRNLLETALTKIDPLGIGLDVAPSGRIKGNAGNVFAIGPNTRPVFWEASSILDIRIQAARLARVLIARPA